MVLLIYAAALAASLAVGHAQSSTATGAPVSQISDGQPQAATSASSSQPTSPSVLPSPNITGTGGWTAALAQAQSFVAQLNLTEKAYMVTGVSGPCVGNIPPIARLGFNGLCLQDGPLAIRQADYASVFPAGLTAAASWDKSLIYQRGVAIGQEFMQKGANVALGPVAGPLGKNSLGGRNWEGFSPDPYLTGMAFSMTIEGMQSTGLQACGKHFIGNEQETQRNPSTTDNGTTILAISSNIDDRTIHELYLWPFADGVKSGLASVMCSYNRLNETYSCENSKVLNGLLKEELGFQGYVMSDWGATHSGLPAITSGLDMDMPGSLGASSTFPPPSYFGGNLTMAVQNGSLPESRLDDMITRVMTPYYLLNQNNGYPTVDPSSGDLNNFDAATSNYSFVLPGPAHRDVRANHSSLIRQMGAEATVLLKNSGSLPLQAPKNIAVFGNDAADLTTGLYGSAIYEYAASPGFDIGTLAVGGGSGQGRLSYVIPPLDAIKARSSQDGALVQYLTDNMAIEMNIGNIYPPPEVCIVFLKTWVTEGSDRNVYEADWNSTGVVDVVSATCNNTIIVTHSGGINTMPYASNPNVTAILAAHLPGQETGNSIVDVLYGAVNPSGRLPYTVANNGSDYNTQIVNMTITNSTDPNAFQDTFTEGLLTDYRYFDSAGITPLYEFGYGMSYTTFNVTDLAVNASTGLTQYAAPVAVQPGGNPGLWEVVLTATATVSNTGGVAGAAVPQLYIGLPQSGVPSGTPPKVLRGFEKVTLEPGESQHVSFDIMRRDVSYWDIGAQDWSIPSGDIAVMCGQSSRDLPLTQRVALR